MATIHDIAASATINIVSVLGFLMGFAFLRLQPVNDRVYFAKWYRKGIRESPRSTGVVKKIVNLDWKTYVMFWTWMPAALRMPEPELTDHAGLDSVAYIRIYLLGLKIFVPIAILAFAVLVPVNWTGNTLDINRDLTFSNIDKLSISNVPSGSLRFVAHVIMAYIFTFWTCYVLYKEYEIVSIKRVRFIAAEKRRPDQFTVLVRSIPPDTDESVSEHVEHFFCVNHPGHYLQHQVIYNANQLAKLVEELNSLRNWLTYYETCYERNPKTRPKTKTGTWGLYGKTVDAIDFHKAEIERVLKEEAAEREKVMNDPQSIVPAAFVSFKSRWGAAVCAQTQQSRDPVLWVTEWAPEPRDVYWDNLAIPYVQLAVNRLIVAVAMFFLTFFFMIPIAFVQSLASIDGIERVFPFLTPVIEMDRLKPVIQGFLPGIVLKIFMAVLPLILMAMSKIEGYTSLSTLDRRTAGKYHFFILVNVFFGSIITGAAFQQLHKFINQSASEIPKTVGVAIPMKATFFITYIMVDGWSGIAVEILRVVPLILFHLKNAFLVKTDKDREQATDPGCITFYITEPRAQLYFLLGLVYSAVTPLILPFIISYFAFSYTIYRHQIINVYDQKYETAAAFWPDVHRRIIIGLIISQVLLLGLLSTKDIGKSIPLILLILPVLTFWFHHFCKGRFESAFLKFPLQEATIKDTLERATDPKLNLKAYLQDAYVHPVFKGVAMEEPPTFEEEDKNAIVSTKRTTNRTSQSNSRSTSSSFRPQTVDESPPSV
ncbi:UNVERIFIED_CONTAM: CSC1-like protein [Sesamum radiatum]|uniref:CSC1-like protein n=1 Tax=Sesamum radiatum TaxID=300843 RepID=A0AAW2UPG6_SESRA